MFGVCGGEGDMSEQIDEWIHPMDKLMREDNAGKKRTVGRCKVCKGNEAEGGVWVHRPTDRQTNRPWTR